MDNEIKADNALDTATNKTYFYRLRDDAVKTAETCMEYAKRYALTDSAKTFKQIAKTLEEAKLTIMTVGEARTGKSSLLSNLLDDNGLFPVDIDITTCIITLVTYAEKEKITLVLEDADGKEYSVEITRDKIPDYAKEQNNPKDKKRARLMLIETPNEMLSSGLVFIDSPGIGSMNPMHSKLTYQFLPRADVVLYVCDATSQISEPELNFLKSVYRGCPNIIFPLTKMDTQGDYQSILEQNRKSIAKDVGIPEDEQIHVPISNRLMMGYRAGGDKMDLEESNFELLVKTIWDLIAQRRPATVVRPRAMEMKYELDVINQAIIVEETAYGKSRDNVIKLKDELDELRIYKRSLLQDNAEWQEEIRSKISSLEGELSSMLDSYAATTRKSVDEKLTQRAYANNPQMLLSEVIGSTEQQIRSMQEFSTEYIDDMRGEFMQKHKMNLAIQADTLKLTSDGSPDIRFAKAKATERISSSGRAIASKSFGTGVFGGIVGGLLGGVVGLFAGGPAGALVGAELGAQIGTGVGTAFGGVAGTIVAVKKDAKYDLTDVKKSINDYISTTVRGWQANKKVFIQNTSRLSIKELRNSVQKSIDDTDEKIKKLQDVSKLTVEELEKKKPDIEKMRALFNKLVARVNDLIEISGQKETDVQAPKLDGRAATAASAAGGAVLELDD